MIMMLWAHGFVNYEIVRYLLKVKILIRHKIKINNQILIILPGHIRTHAFTELIISSDNGRQFLEANIEKNNLKFSLQSVFCIYSNLYLILTPSNNIS